MRDASLCVEATVDLPKISVIIGFVLAENCVRNQIRELNETRGSGVEKHRDLGEIPCYAVGVARIFEFPCKGLNPDFSRGLVEKDEPALRILIKSVKPSKVLIEPAAQLLECNLSDILAGIILFLEYSREQPYLRVAFAYAQLQRFDDRIMTVSDRKLVPSVSASPHWGTVQLNVMGGKWRKMGGDSI